MRLEHRTVRSAGIVLNGDTRCSLVAGDTLRRRAEPVCGNAVAEEDARANVFMACNRVAIHNLRPIGDTAVTRAIVIQLSAHDGTEHVRPLAAASGMPEAPDGVAKRGQAKADSQARREAKAAAKAVTAASTATEPTVDGNAAA